MNNAQIRGNSHQNSQSPSTSVPNTQIQENEESYGTEAEDYRPQVQVKIINHEFTALLDTGSSISLLGCQFVDLLLDSNIKTYFSPKSIHQAEGSFVTERAVDLVIE